MIKVWILFGSLGLSLAAQAGDMAAGKARAGTCASCHGAAGISASALWPNLAGQQEQYLIKQLKAFREGERTDPLMSPMSKSLSDEDIEDLAAYFANLR